MASTASKATCKHHSQQRTNSWEQKHPRVIVYDPREHNLSFELEETLNKNDGFPVQLPRWRNRVDIYLDNKHKSGFVTSIDLGQLGVGKNLKRRLRYDYKAMHVKGVKPLMPSLPADGRVSFARSD